MLTTPRLTQPQQLCFRRPAFAACAALHIEHRGLDREQLAVALDQSRHRQRGQVGAFALRHPDVATRGLLEVAERVVPVTDLEVDHKRT